MTMYAGLDVSDKTTHICVANSDGAVLRRDVMASDPDVWAAAILCRAVVARAEASLTAARAFWTCNGFAPVTDFIMPPLLRTPAG